MTNSTATDQVRIDLRNFSAHYQYDTSYMEALLDTSPVAYEKFAAATGTSEGFEALSAEAAAVAKAAVLLADDCGPCLQLSLRMAVEAGVRRDLLLTVLDRPDALPQPLLDIYRHAQQVVAGENGDLERIGRLRAALGEQAFGELAVTIAGVRLYPSIKRALGAAKSCHRPSLNF